MCNPDCFLALLAILFPPLPVWVKRGICSADSLINLALCCLGFLPGLFHAWYIISKYPDETVDYTRIDEEQNVRARHQQRRQPSHGRMVYTVPAPTDGYGSFGGNGEGRYQYQQHHAQQGNSRGQGHGEGPPSYASVVKGDHKVQH